MKKTSILALGALLLMACNQSGKQATTFSVPAFDKISMETYLPTFEAAVAANKEEIDAIVSNPEEP